MAKRNRDLIATEFTPSRKQKELINTIISNDITVVKGTSGSGKSSGVLYHYCLEYMRDPAKEIVIIRTPIEAGDDEIGFIKGGMEEKIGPHFQSAKKILEKFIGKAKVEADLGKRIHFTIPNFLLGDTLDNSLVMLDEAQSLSPRTIKLILERIGQNSKCVVLGDPSQQYFRDEKRNGLTDLIKRAFDIGIDGYVIPNVEGFGYVEFGIEDTMRSDITRRVLKLYNTL